VSVLLLLVAVVAAARAHEGGSDGTASTGRPRMAKPRRGAQIVVGPVAVPRGEELTGCTLLKLPSTRDLAVNHVRIKVRGGSHHIHLYRPYDHAATYPDGYEVCNFALNLDVWQLVLASQSLYLDWKLPKGIAFHFRAGEQLLAQTHYVDNGLLSSPPDGWAVFNLQAIPERKVTSYAGAFFGQDRDVVVPARSTVTATTRCVFPRPVRLLAMTGHYHFRGTRFTAASWDGATAGPPVYDFSYYSDPLFARYDESTPEIPGIEWSCTYVNDTDQEYRFGPFTDRNEHCNLFAFYYPAVGTNEFMTCVQQDAVVTVKVTN
jgi:hypothetical protein